MEKPSFLEGYKIHEKPEAIKAAKRKETRTGEKGIVANRSERIQAYLERLEEIFIHPVREKGNRRIQLFKEKFLYPAVLIKKENFPDSYFEFQKQQAKERGQGEISFTKEQKAEEITKVMESQRLSLDSWIDYLTSDDCKYPTDIKFFAMQGVLKLGKFDTERYSFARRDKATTAPFCEIDREALSTVLGALEAKHHNGDISNYPAELLSFIDNRKSFGDMYAETMRDLDKKASKEDLLHITDGEWKVFEKGSDPQELVNSLAGKRSNLCIADIGSATRYLENGSVEVFFSHNRAKQPTVPRIAVAANEQGVYEVRGTYNKNEDTDPFISETDVLSQRIKNISGGKSFMVKDVCMKRMTNLYNKCFKVNRKTGKKIYLNPQLTEDNIIFLYEVNEPIKGFGYWQDPRVKELQYQRENKIKEDIAIIFKCAPDQVALNKKDITENTRAYIGPLSPGVFKTNIKHIYISFPEREIRKYKIKIGGKTSNQLKKELNEEYIYYSKEIDNMMKSQDFIISENIENINLIRLTIDDLNLQEGATVEEIYRRAEELGLELCPSETGPHLRLQYLGKEPISIGMKPIMGTDGDLNIFTLDSSGGNEDLILRFETANPARRWRGGYFVFRLPKSVSDADVSAGKSNPFASV